MEQLALVSHNFFRANGFHKSRSPSSSYGPAPQGSQLITLLDTLLLTFQAYFYVLICVRKSVLKLYLIKNQ